MGAVKRENAKVYIKGVRPVSWATGEMCEFASSVVSAMNSLGDTTSYGYVMATSGVAFRFTVSPDEEAIGQIELALKQGW